MRDRRGLRRAVVGVLIGTAVLSGCSEKQEASESLPTSSASETTQALPALGPPDFPVPEDARQQSPEAAVEFVRYYVALTQYLALNSQDPDALLQLSQDCRTCNQVAQSLAADVAAGYTYREYKYQFHEYGPALVNGDTAEVGFTYLQGPIIAVDQGGQTVPDRSAATPVELQSGAVLRWKEGIEGWVVTGLTVG